MRLNKLLTDVFLTSMGSPVGCLVVVLRSDAARVKDGARGEDSLFSSVFYYRRSNLFNLA